MNIKEHEYVPAVLNGLAGIGVLLISFFVELRIPMPLSTAKIIGIIVVYLGMALVVWATFHIRGAISGMVKPRLSELVITGPYRFIRHSVYVGTTVALIGVTLSLRSWIGFLAVLILFLPSEIHRAKLEEKALAGKFGTKRDEYHKQTGGGSLFESLKKGNKLKIHDGSCSYPVR